MFSFFSDKSKNALLQNGSGATAKTSSTLPVVQKPVTTSTMPVPPKPNKVDIAFSDELPMFVRNLYDVISMAPSTRHVVCPVEVVSQDGKQKFSMICLVGHGTSDIANEVIKQLLFRGYAKAETFLYEAPQAVMVELARNTINAVAKSTKQATSLIGKQTHSALWKLFESVVLFAMKNEASDIHFEIERSNPSSQVRFRVDGLLTSPKQYYLGTDDVLDTVAYIFNVHGKSGSENTFNENKPQSCQVPVLVKGRKLLFRWASNQTSKGTKVVLRMLYQDTTQTIKQLDALGYLPLQIEIWKRAIMRLGGGTLLAGVVGSGKSTTMQTVMSMLPDWMARYTVEDPVEYEIPGTSQFSVSRTMSADEKNLDPFLAVKRQLKQMDPDVVLIGEIRDYESASLFRDVAESGHRAFATIHAPSAIDMITLRLVSEEIGIPKGVIATPGFINLLVYQALVPRLCIRCNLTSTRIYSAEYLGRIKKLFDINHSAIRAKNPEGCAHCNREALPELNGSRGRIVVAEMIELNSIMLHLFREGKNSELKEYVKSLQTARYDEPDSTGKSALEVAMFHVSEGRLDPRDVEMKFGSFEQYENELKR